MARNVAEQVVVITGASSGIGRQTALTFAGHGARVVVAARNAQALDSVSREIHRLGGEALAVPTDVGNFAQVDALAGHAVDRFGRIDTWVNNAAVSTYGTIEQMDVAELARVIQVDLLGAIHGMKAALPHLHAGGGGTIVNVSSVEGKRAIPLQAAYSAAKHGLVAFGEALRLELRYAGAPIDVVDVLPASVNTPLFDHARSKLGVLPGPIPPTYDPQVVADTIVAVAGRPVRQVFAGGVGRLLDLAQRLSPALVDWVLLGPGRIFDLQRTDQPDNARDNLFQASVGGGRVTGRFGHNSKGTSLYTQLLGLHPARSRMLAGEALLAVTAVARRIGRRA